MIRLALALLLIAGPAAAAPQCGDRAAIVQSLTGTYGETRRGIGLAANNAVLEVFAADAGSWTARSIAALTAASAWAGTHTSTRTRPAFLRA